MGKDWILETVVKGKKKKHIGRGRWALPPTAPVLAWHALGTEGWGLGHACSPPADAKANEEALALPRLYSSGGNPRRHISACTVCDTCYKENKQRGITEANSGEGTLLMDLPQGRRSEKMT